jgi:aryl-alcohol dehydrogenase-like predicted oxidoreductase
MQYRYLGKSGLRVSEIALGTMTLGGRGMFANVGNGDVNAARRLLDVAIDRGVNLIDTANGYSDGLAEEILGEALHGRRERVLIASKGRMAVGDGPNDAGLSRHYLIRAVEDSLRRLHTDHIDLYQVHEWDGKTPLEETLDALDTLVRDGKIRYIGSSNYSAWQLMKALSISERRGLQRFISQQIHYTLQAREAEYELVPIAIDQGVGILVWSPLAAGLLTGKFRRGQKGPQGARHTLGWPEPPVYDEDKLYEIIDALVEIGESRGVSAAQVALSWLLARPGVTSTIVGARTVEQLEDNLAAADLTLAGEERARLDKITTLPLLYPHWHHAEAASDRLGPADLPLLSPHLTQ